MTEIIPYQTHCVRPVRHGKPITYAILIKKLCIVLDIGGRTGRFTVYAEVNIMATEATMHSLIVKPVSLSIS